jgi:hypothetical protein
VPLSLEALSVGLLVLEHHGLIALTFEPAPPTLQVTTRGLGPGSRYTSLGDWRVNVGVRPATLYNLAHDGYAVPLDTLQSMDDIVLAHDAVAATDWATPTDLSDLAAAFAALFGTPIELDAHGHMVW